MFAPFPQTTHHLAVVFSTFTEIPGKQVVTDMLQQCVEVIWLICKRSNRCLTESQVGPIFWLFLAFRASKMRTLTNPGFGIKTKWRRGAAHNGGGATTHAPCAQKTRFFNCTKLSWPYDALTKRTWTNFGYKKGICHKINLKNGLLRMYFDLSRTVYLAASTLCCSAVSINERAMRTQRAVSRRRVPLRTTHCCASTQHNSSQENPILHTTNRTNRTSPSQHPRRKTHPDTPKWDSISGLVHSMYM